MKKLRHCHPKGKGKGFPYSIPSVGPGVTLCITNWYFQGLPHILAERDTLAAEMDELIWGRIIADANLSVLRCPDL